MITDWGIPTTYSSIALAIVRVIVAFKLDLARFTYHNDLSNTIIVEPGTAIIVACCPLLRPFFGKVSPAIATFKRRRSKPSGTDDLESLNTLTGGEIPNKSLNGPKSNVEVSCHASRKNLATDHNDELAVNERGGISITTQWDMKWTPRS